MHTHDRDEGGSATLEFLAGTLLLLIPIIYLILTFSHVQAATYAAEASARASGRVFTQATDEHEARSQAARITSLAFADHGFTDLPDGAVTVTCESTPCLTPGSGIHIRVMMDVTLPLVPDLLATLVPTSITVSADAFTTVDRFKGAP